MIILLLSLIAHTTAVNVVLSFDDNWFDHLQAAQDLGARNAKGVFYVNSDRLGETNRLTMQDLHTIANLGHEIGGHTKRHINLSTQNYNKQKKHICDDRDLLLAQGFNITTFAFPYGADTPEAFELLGKCGYNGARDSGGIRTPASCTLCPKSDSIPPQNPQQVRSVSYRHEMGVEGLKWYVQEADTDPKYYNGVITFIFHEYGEYPNKQAYILPSEFTEFVDWLNANNIPIITLDEAINKRIYPNFKNISPGQAPTGKPYIALTFDDGTIDHYEVSRILERYDMRGTFFINSNTVGQPGFLSKSQLQEMQSRRHEIGGHGPNQYEHLVSLEPDIQLQRIQQDYDSLTNMGFHLTSFAWPYGETSDSLISAVKTVGYQRARDVGGLRIPTGCNLCPSTLELPLSDANKYAIRSFNVKSFHDLGDLMWQVWRAEDWALQNPEKESMLVFNFQTICYGCAFSPDRFESFLRWMYPRYKIGTVNKLLNYI
jgi:peptidoglycan/xylan/chitin deacetylase (PgdA/CDA1 family)